MSLRLAIIGSRGFPSTYGGYETLVRHLARDLVLRGHQVTVYCRTREEARRSWDREGVHCIYTPGIDSKSLSTLTFGATACADAARRDFDAALVLNIANGFFLPLLRMRGTPTAVNTDGIEWERGKWGPTARRVFRAGALLTARHATALVADSQAIAAVWQELFDAESHFIPYGGDPDQSVGDDRLAEHGLAPDRYALAVARLIPENNVDLFLDALEATGNGKPNAVVVGSANFDAPIEARLRALEDEGRVRWLGHVSDQELLTQLWANAGVYVHGHSVGGTNPGLIQALAVGAPTLALDTPFNREVLRADGQLFPHDRDALGQMITTMLGSADWRSECQARGRDIVRERYRWDDVCAHYAELLERLAATRSRRRRS